MVDEKSAPSIMFRGGGPRLSSQLSKQEAILDQTVLGDETYLEKLETFMQVGKPAISLTEYQGSFAFLYPPPLCPPPAEVAFGIQSSS